MQHRSTTGGTKLVWGGRGVAHAKKSAACCAWMSMLEMLASDNTGLGGTRASRQSTSFARHTKVRKH